jgi:hypothetical protein
MEISDWELTQKVKELDELHNDKCFPEMMEAANEWAEKVKEEASKAEAKSRVNRRTFVMGLGATLGTGAVLAACGTSKPATKKTTLPASTLSDLHVAALAASLENLGVYAYTAGIKAATAGKIGTVPTAVVVFAQTARAQHEQHGAAWNAILASVKEPKVTVTDPVLTPVVNKDFAKVTNYADLAKLALEIEEIAAETYLSAIGALHEAAAIKTAATIEPVEMQHAAILNFVLGNYPVPNAFEPTNLARPLSDYTKL